jgi:hypothetical protein
MNRRPQFGIRGVDAGSRTIGATLDPSIVERARRGDLEAFESIVADRIGAVYRLTFAIVGNEADAADASTPTPAILIGHFNDPRASLCSRDGPQVCLGRFVVDAVPWTAGFERALPERIDLSNASTIPHFPGFDPVERVRSVATIGTALNIVAVSRFDLKGIEPGFNVRASWHSSADLFWIVMALIDGTSDQVVGTFVVDAAGTVFYGNAPGNAFEVLSTPGPTPGPT